MRFIAALLSTNLRAAFALRTAFWMQACLMALNNLIMFIFWWIMFERFEQIRGWRLEDVALLHGVVTVGFGLSAVLAGGVSTISQKIDDGELDPMLVQPRNVLVQAVLSKTAADGFGDIVSGMLLMIVSGHVGGATWLTALLAVTLSASMFVSTGVLIHSAAFWLSRTDNLARQAWDFIIMFSVYPPPLFQGVVRIVLFTVLPAGFISYLPVALIREFDGATLMLAVLGTSAYVALAIWTFFRGLRRYASGSRFGVRV